MPESAGIAKPVHHPERLALIGIANQAFVGRYSHIIEDARLSPLKPMADAIYEARAELAESGASSVCLADAPTVLRRSLGST